MISLIICSRSKEAILAVKKNVESTVGVPYELVVVDNSQNKYGICEAYNIGAKQAKYELLCFMHEDIYFHTAGWGQVVGDILADQTIGVLGVAGGTFQLKAPSSWWFPGQEYHRMQVLHTIAGRELVLDLVNPTGQGLADVAVLDGLWLCSRREVWAAHPFDAKTFSEFHFYDVDYCTTIFVKYRICVTYDILIEHFSSGSINMMWIDNCIKYYDKWQSALPLKTVEVDKQKEVMLEVDAIFHLIDLLIWNKMPLKEIYRWLSEAVQRGGFDRRILGVCKQVLKHRLAS